MVRRGGDYAQCSATLEITLTVIYILGKHGEVASLRLGHLRGIFTGLRLARGCLRPRAGTRRLYLYPQAQRVTNTSSADAVSISTNSHSECTSPRDGTTCPSPKWTPKPQMMPFDANINRVYSTSSHTCILRTNCTSLCILYVEMRPSSRPRDQPTAVPCPEVLR
jgi:hypothetical protein